EVFPKKRSLELNEALKESWRNLFKKYSEILGEEQGVQLTSDIYGAIQLLE
ncbi:MAG: MarR family transcriptional regulator, partial [Bacteroidetes bacterium CG_4_10_14_3_um_filter_42_6]